MEDILEQLREVIEEWENELEEISDFIELNPNYENDLLIKQEVLEDCISKINIILEDYQTI